MAPLFLPCNRLYAVYSPYTNRRASNLPGQQGRSIPFVRPCKNISKLHTVVVQAVSENIVEEHSGNNGANGSRESNGTTQQSTGLLAVHGGERAGRPRVSGKASFSRLKTQSHHLSHHQLINHLLNPIFSRFPTKQTR